MTAAEPSKFLAVPPILKARVVVSFAADPVVFWLSVGISDATIALNVGAPAAPFGAAKRNT